MKIKEGYFELADEAVVSAPGSELAGVPVMDRDRVVQIAREVCPKVAEWAEPFSVIMPARIPSVSLAVAATCPDVAQDIIITISQLSLIFFAMDDLVDGAIGAYTHSQTDVLLDFYTKIVDAGGASCGEYLYLLDGCVSMDETQPWMQVANALAKCCESVHAYPGGAKYYPFFAKHFSASMQGMSKELVWQQTLIAESVYPSYEEYILSARSSILSPPVMGALLAMTGSSSEGWDPEATEKILDEIVLAEGTCIRLSNDIRSYERETVFDRKPNSLSILGQVMSQEEAKAKVLEEVESHLQELQKLVWSLPRGLRRWGKWGIRQVWFAKEWYLVREFHHFSEAMLSALATSR